MSDQPTPTGARGTADSAAAAMAGSEDIMHPLSRCFAWVDSHSVRNAIGVLLGVAALVLALLDFIIHRHAYIALEGTPGFYALVGFGAFAFVVLMGWPLRRLLSRPPNYYSDEDQR